MIGKYSPTVSAAYSADQLWFYSYCGDDIYDVDGYNSYGYNTNDVDRAGIKEDTYAQEDERIYDRVWRSWGYDGTKPVRIR